MNFTYKYARPAVTCETAVFDLTDVENPRVLLIRRKYEPFKDMLALPGGFMEEDEELKECAARELKEETGIDLHPRNFFNATVSGAKNRDPRGRIISIVYTSTVDEKTTKIQAGDDASHVEWYNLTDLTDQELASDHRSLIDEAYNYWLRFLEID